MHMLSPIRLGIKSDFDAGDPEFDFTPESSGMQKYDQASRMFAERNMNCVDCIDWDSMSCVVCLSKLRASLPAQCNKNKMPIHLP